MELSEGKLFTIESLNRIEGFEWPEGAEFSAFDPVGSCILFYRLPPKPSKGEFVGGCIGGSMIETNTLHPDWKSSLITRAEFESVDGWVRNDGKSILAFSGKAVIEYIKRNESMYWEQAEFVDLIHTGSAGDIMKWRYHKPQNQVEQPTQQPESSIESLISQHKAAKQSTLEARRLLEQAEAIEHNLLLSIEAWAESNGFDIRVLDEVKK